MELTFDNIRQTKSLLFEYVRGSHLYSLNTPESDIDTSGLFIAPKESLLGLGFDYKGQVSDERNDNTWYEIGKWVEMIIKSNPTVLESLFIPENKMITKPHPILQDVLENRNEFITKDCFMPFIGYSLEQIKKAKGLNKMINWDKEQMVRKTPFDFAYTFYKQGSTKISDWLDNRGLNKDFCGLVHIPNMHDTYGVYYDWGAHFEKYGIKTIEDFQKRELDYDFATSFYGLHDVEGCEEFMEAQWFEDNKAVKHYRGMCLENATDMRGSSVSKGERPIVYMVYNESGFQAHCVKYKQYQDWIKHRNPKRYESNLNKSYDSKNLCHTCRLLHMGYEIATGQGIILDRNVAGDRDFLMKVRNHGFEYDELMEIVMSDKSKLDKAIKESTIKEHIDVNMVNDLLLDMRKKWYGIS